MKEVPGHHDRVRDLEDDHLDGLPHPLLGQLGLGHVSGESVQEEPRGLRPLLHGARHQLHNLVLANVKLINCQALVPIPDPSSWDLVD